MFDLADIRPGIVNFFVFMGMAMVTIPFAKFLFAKFPVPGFSELAGSL